MVENRPWLSFLTHLVLMTGVVIVVFPVYLAFIASTHGSGDFMRGLVPLLPGPHMLENYGRMLTQGISTAGAPPVSIMLMNSTIIAIVIAVGKIAISLLSAYAIVFFKFPFRLLAFWIIFITLMLPVEVRIIPTFAVVANLGLLNSYVGLTLPLIASATATFLFRQFFKRWISTSEQFRWGSVECVFDKECPWQNDRAVAAMEDVRLQLLQARPEDIAACIRFMSATTILGELSEIRVPVLNIVGAEDAIVPPAHQLRVSKLLPQAQTVLLRNCGHLPMVEHQTMTAGIISAFVDGMSALQAKARRPVLSPSGKAASQLFRLMAQTLYRTEQTPAGRVQTAQDSISTKA